MSFFAPGEHHEAPTVGGDVIVLIGSPFDGQAESPLNAPEKISSAWP